MLVRHTSILLLLLALAGIFGCTEAASMAGPVPKYSDNATYVSAHRRIPQSVHGRSGVVSDLRWQNTRQNSERLHIGDWSSRDNSSLPAYHLTFDGQTMLIRVYAVHCTPQLWEDKLADFAQQSDLIEDISWQLAEDELCLELQLTFTQAVQYRSWYYTNTCYFTVELTAADE